MYKEQNKSFHYGIILIVNCFQKFVCFVYSGEGQEMPVSPF
nr:MAG TPA: hypothetical protein [Caudoviricetes sp.]